MADIELIDECSALSMHVSVPDGKIVVEAETLGDALAQIEGLLGVSFTPFQGDELFEGGQYFVVYPPRPRASFVDFRAVEKANVSAWRATSPLGTAGDP